MDSSNKSVEYLVVDTTGFIQNAPLQNIGQHILTCQEVVDEIINKRQLRRLVVLPYDLNIKQVFGENVKIVTEFAQKTGDYQSLSATDIKVMALTYQLEKEYVGLEHIRLEPIMQRRVTSQKSQINNAIDECSGFYTPRNIEKEIIGDEKIHENDAGGSELVTKLECTEEDILSRVKKCEDAESTEEESDSDDGIGWITPLNIQTAKKQINSELIEERSVKVACMTTDFAMQNVLKQMNLNVAALDGRMIKQLRTFILRCYTCFGTTSIMTKVFCPKCGNKTLKRVSVTLDENGKQQIHINTKRPLTARGKKFSLPRIQGGKHSSNPWLVEDQPVPDQRSTKLALTKNNPLDDDYIAGYSPFIMRDVTSKSAQLKIRPITEVKHWMRKNPNETVRQRKK